MAGIGGLVVIVIGGAITLYGLSNKKWLVMLLGLGLVLFGLFLVA